MYSNLLRLIGTRQQQLRYMFELDQILQRIFKAGFHFEDAVKESAGRDFAKELLDLHLDSENLSSLRRQLQSLLDQIAHMNSMEIYIGFEPTEVTIQKIVAWVKKEVAAECLVEILVKRTIIGGATISFQGKYADLSLKTKLLHTFQSEGNWIRSYFDL